MKKIWLVALFFCMVGVMGEDVLLKTWELGKKEAYATYMTSKQAVKQSVADDVVTLEVVKNDAEKKNASEIQFWCGYANGFKAGVKYRIEATVRADRAVGVEALVILTSSPWTRVAGKYYNLKANEDNSIQLEFTPKEALTAVYRTPCIFLGNAEAGTVYRISSVKLYEVKQ